MLHRESGDLNSNYENLLHFIHKLEFIYGISEKTFSEISQIDLQSWADVKQGKALISIPSLFKISKYFNVPLDKILNGSVNYHQLNKTLSGSIPTLPDHYIVGAKGRKRTVINILKFIESKYGIDEVRLVLKQFQLMPIQFANEEESINNFFLIDLLKTLKRMGYKEKDFFQMGEYSYEVNRSGAVSNALSGSRDYENLIIDLFEKHISLFDNNYLYSIQSLKKGKALIKMIPNPEVQSALKVKKLGSLDALIMKLGVLKSTPRYIGQSDFKATIAKSVHLGDPYCMFAVTHGPESINTLQ